MKISLIPSMLVVARHNEDISWLSEVMIPHVVYDKGEASPHGVKVENNSGIDSETHLSFIVEHYQCLPERIFFTQGNPFAHVCEADFFGQLRKWTSHGEVQKATPVFPIAPILIHWRYLSDNHSGIEDAVMKTWEAILPPPMPELLYYPGGQIFGMSAKRIRAKELGYWQNILDNVRASQASCEYNGGYHGQSCNCLSPFSPACIERLWFYL